MAGENEIQIPIILKAKNSFASKGSVGKQTKKTSHVALITQVLDMQVPSFVQSSKPGKHAFG